MPGRAGTRWAARCPLVRHTPTGGPPPPGRRSAVRPSAGDRRPPAAAGVGRAGRGGGAGRAGPGGRADHVGPVVDVVLRADVGGGQLGPPRPAREPGRAAPARLRVRRADLARGVGRAARPGPRGYRRGRLRAGEPAGPDPGPGDGHRAGGHPRPLPGRPADAGRRAAAGGRARRDHPRGAPLLLVTRPAVVPTWVLEWSSWSDGVVLPTVASPWYAEPPGWPGWPSAS